MKTPRFRPIKSPEGWRVNVPSSLSKDGKRVRRFFPTRDAADAFASQLRSQLAQHGFGAKILPPAHTDAAARAFVILGEDAAPETLLEAAREYVDRHNMRLNSIPFENAFQQFRDAQPRSPSYAESLRQYQARFIAFHGRMLCDITAKDIENAMTGFPPSVFNYSLRILSSVFNHGKKRDWCAINPIEKLDRKKLPLKEVEIYSPQEVAAFFRVADAALIPWLAVCMFAGLRASEGRKMTWGDFDFTENFIRIRSVVSKTRRPRAIPMEDNLREWLLPFRRDDSALIAPQGVSALRKQFRTAHRIGSVRRIKHGPRHSYASYLLARDGSIDKLLLNMGHTNAATTFKHYHRVASQRAARAFWSVRPLKDWAGKVVAMVAT